MPVVDHLLNSLIKYLQKKQKQRKKNKKKKHNKSRVSPKRKKSKATKKISKRKKKTVQKKSKKRNIKKVSRKPIRRAKRTIRPAFKKKPHKSSKHLKVKKAKKKLIESVKIQKQTNETCVGEVTHFFSGIKVIVLKMKSSKILVGDKIHIKGRKTDFFQIVKSLQIESVDVKVARKGQLVGLKVSKKAKEGDKVFKVG